MIRVTKVTEIISPFDSYHNCIHITVQYAHKNNVRQLQIPGLIQYSMYLPQDAYYQYLFSLTSILDPGVKVNVPRKPCSNPKRLDLRIVQPVTVQFISTFGWLDICRAPAATIVRGQRDPLIIGRDQKVWRGAREDGGLHNAHKRVQNE